MITEIEKGYIRQDYRLAKRPKEQIRIMAELFDVTQREIMEILGLPVPVKKHREGGKKAWQRRIDDAKQDLLDGLTIYEIAAKRGMHPKTVEKYVL